MFVRSIQSYTLRRGEKYIAKNTVPIFTPFSCVQLIIAQMTENTPQRCITKDLVERTKPRKIYTAFSIFAESTKGGGGRQRLEKIQTLLAPLINTQDFPNNSDLNNSKDALVRVTLIVGLPLRLTSF